MNNPPTNMRAMMIALTLAGMAPPTIAAGMPETANPSATSAPGQVRVANKVAAPYATLAGSQENAIALANALRTGTPATLTYLSVAPDGTTTINTVTITPPTRPMGWGNVSHSLTLAQFALARAGITNPTGAQLQAALQGGSVTTADGNTTAFAGVLQQRADGMGWGRIAHTYGTTLGAVNHGIKAPATTVAVTTPIATPKVQPVAVKPGLTTAAGTTVGANHGAKGLTTAASATSYPRNVGIVSANGNAHGNGNAYGRGVITAAGSGAGVASSVNASTNAGKGVVTGTGSVGHVVTANPDHGAGSAKGNGKGKNGG